MNGLTPHLSGLLAILLTLASLISPLITLSSERAIALPQALAEEPVLSDAGAVRVAYLYSDDGVTAEAFVGFLNAHDFDATALPVTAPDRILLIYLPLVLRGSGTIATDVAKPPDTAGSLLALPDFSAFDLIIVGADTGFDGAFSPEPGLVAAIEASGLPVVGLGDGGHALFGALGLDIGHPHGIRRTAQAVKVADAGASQPFYTTPSTIALPPDEVLTLYTSQRSVVAVTLEAPLPLGVRVASLPDAPTLFPIVRSGDHYLLWGFEGSPDTMTTTGQQLFLNALWFQVGGLTLPLRSRHFTPAPGIEPALLDALAASSDGLHAFVQLNALPTPAEQEALAAANVALLEFLSGTAYTAFVDNDFDPAAPAIDAHVRWMGRILVDDRVDPKVLADDFEPWADNDDGTVNLMVAFFPDIAPATAESILATHVVSYDAYSDQLWAVVVAKSAVLPLASEDPVRWIEEGPRPPEYPNDAARAELFVDEVQNANLTVTPPFYAGLDGNGVAVGVFDSGVGTSTFTHPDFTGRLLRTATEILATDHNAYGHGTHVAGIIGGDGSRSVANCPAGTCTDFQLRGMAPAVSLAPYISGWTAAEMDEAVNDFGATITNHSYTMSCGAYNNSARDVDRLVRGDLQNGSTAIPAHLAVWAAANQGTSAQYCTTATLPGGAADSTSGPRGYYSVLSPGKNQLVVGSLNPGSDYAVRPSSSRGPTFDGRLKPEVMSIGCEWSTDVDSNGYVRMCGTSMAAPSVAGISALLVEQYQETFPTAGRPRPATLKAILIQTATDLVHHPGQAGFTEYTWNDPDSGEPIIFHRGPDWSTGYGVVHAPRAVAAVRGRNFVEGSVSPTAPTDTYTLEIPPGRTEFKVTLAWDDEPGNPTLAVTATQLVNDLDLMVIAPNGTVYRPWVLTAPPRNPNAYNASNQDTGVADPIVRANHITPAVRGVDRLNNVEQVLVTDTVQLQPGTWTVRVNAFALPNNNAQSYSLAGDFRVLNIVEPQTGNVAEAGDPTNPNVILVVVEGRNALTGEASTLTDAEVTDFAVTVDGLAADVVSGLPVGDQFWLNVRPQPGTYTAGSKYDLAVTWAGYGIDSETRAVLFTEREVTDRAIVIDTSGSMYDYDKMTAAQNAARLFIDQSLIGDRIAVIQFASNASTPYSISEVSSDPTTPELNAAKNIVSGLTPGGMTAIGQGLLAGQAEVTAPPGDFSISDVIVLLSDGMENIDPRYDTAAVRGVIEPSDTIIHTVAVGPANAGHHTLLAQIAGDNGGRSYHVTESGVGTTGTSLSGTALASYGEGLAAWPGALANRLGDNYKSIAEEILGEVRLFQASDLVDLRQGYREWRVEVPSGLPRITFAVNWVQENEWLQLLVTDPDGQQYAFDPKDNNICRSDVTHETCIIETPIPGTWTVRLNFLEASSGNEYVIWASARTPVTFQLFVATPPHDRIVHQEVQLLAFLHQQGKPLPGQTVEIIVYGPHGQTATPLQLMDDGKHGDGQASNGVYGASFISGSVAGAYNVRGRATGTSLEGEPFSLLRSSTFHLQPRALYVHSSDTGTALAYRRLLQESSLAVDLAPVGVVPTLNLQKYQLILIGPETGYLDDWGTFQAFSAIVRSEKPVLGLGEGGYAFFGELGLSIGFPWGAHGQGRSIVWEMPNDVIWRYPYEFELPKEPLSLYRRDSRRVGIYLGDRPSGVTVFGYHENNQLYADLIMERGYWILWGFQDGPASMTTTGREVFVNTAFRLVQ